MFKSNMKTTKSIPENGIIYCFGIDEFDHEIFEGIIPSNPVDRFCYKCDRYFHLDQYNKLFEKKADGFVVLIDGRECFIYRYTGIWTRVKHFDAVLISRQRKGGQSSVRFARLAEESRLHYITHVVDEVNALITNNKSNNYVFGGEELKMMFLSSSALKPKFRTESSHHAFNRDTINEPYFMNLMNKVNVDDSNQIAEQIVTLIDTEPEYLMFSLDEIMENIANIEHILIVSGQFHHMQEHFGKKAFILNAGCSYYGRFIGFNVIGKLYFKNEMTYEIDE